LFENDRQGQRLPYFLQEGIIGSHAVRVVAVANPRVRLLDRRHHQEVIVALVKETVLPDERLAVVLCLQQLLLDRLLEGIGDRLRAAEIGQAVGGGKVLGQTGDVDVQQADFDLQRLLPQPVALCLDLLGRAKALRPIQPRHCRRELQVIPQRQRVGGRSVALRDQAARQGLPTVVFQERRVKRVETGRAFDVLYQRLQQRRPFQFVIQHVHTVAGLGIKRLQSRVG